VIAPADPRTDWQLPAPGTMPIVTPLDPLTVRVLAENPSPMTLDGTNTYVIGEAGTGAAFVVDPGPPSDTHRDLVAEVLVDRDATCVAVLVTHHHPDHAAAAAAWAAHFACQVVAPTPDVAGDGGRVVTDGERLTLAGVDVHVVTTPGHSSDHTSYRLGDGPMLSGDHVLGRGTSVVAWPDGDLAAYLDSLRRVRDLRVDALYPGHGPALTDDPTAVIDYYLEHRAFRRTQVLAALEEGPADPASLVRRIYADVDAVLWPAAERSTRATLDLLAREGVVAFPGHGTATLRG